MEKKGEGNGVWWYEEKDTMIQELRASPELGTGIFILGNRSKQATSKPKAQSQGRKPPARGEASSRLHYRCGVTVQVDVKN